MNLATLLHRDRPKGGDAPQEPVEDSLDDLTDTHLRETIIRNATDGIGYGSLRSYLERCFRTDLDALGGTPTFDTYIGLQIYLGHRERISGRNFFENIREIAELYDLAIRAKACGAIEGIDSMSKLQAALYQQRLYNTDYRSPLRLLQPVAVH